MRCALISAHMMPLNDNILSAMQSDEAEQDALAGRSPTQEEEGPEANSASSHEDTDETFEAQVCLSLSMLCCMACLTSACHYAFYLFAMICCCTCHYVLAHGAAFCTKPE